MRNQALNQIKTTAMKSINRLLLLLILLVGNTVIFAQGGKTVSGVVSDDAGLPVQSATVQEKGTTNSTQTDATGRYTITVAGNNAVLVITAISFGVKEVAVGN